MVGQGGRKKKEERRTNDFFNRVWSAGLYAYHGLYKTTAGKSMGDQRVYDEIAERKIRLAMSLELRALRSCFKFHFKKMIVYKDSINNNVFARSS